jgi:chromosome segregation ATPase
MDLEQDLLSREHDSEGGIGGDERSIDDTAEPQPKPSSVVPETTNQNGGEGAASTAGESSGGDLMDFLSDVATPEVAASIAPVTSEPCAPPIVSEDAVDDLESSEGNPVNDELQDVAALVTATDSNTALDEARIRPESTAETQDILDHNHNTALVDGGGALSASPALPPEAPDLLSPPCGTGILPEPVPDHDPRSSSPGKQEMDASTPVGVAPSQKDDPHSPADGSDDATAITVSETDTPQPFQSSTSINGEEKDRSGPSGVASNEDRVRELEALLAQQESKAARREEETTALLAELQESLQQQMTAKAEAENKSRLLETKMKHLEEVNGKQSKGLADMADMQSVLQEHMEAKAEAELKHRSALDQVAQLEAEAQPQVERIQALEGELAQLQKLQAAQSDELTKIRAERDDQHRKEQSLVSRLNAAKKEQAEHANLAERLEDEIRALEQDLESTKKELSEVSHAKVLVENELEVLKKTSENRLRSLEAALLDERNLNDERKRKMKLFVESKSEELRQAKADNDSLQVELAQTNKSLVDLNGRWKQLHAQWVQSQTRNRELQRDLNRIKKDSENLHKVGDTLEMKLSRSATETEEHKSKRLAAKHELMTVLRALELERELTSTLRDSLKFTFTPKALSQQQLLREGLQDFEAQLQKLSLRLGRALPGSADADTSMNSDAADHSDSGLTPDPADLVNGGSDDSALQHTRTDVEVQRLISKLEYETQRVSQGIMALSGSIERMHLMLDASGDRTCYTVLSELLTTGARRASVSSSSATSEETRRLGSLRSSHQYGQVSSSFS